MSGDTVQGRTNDADEMEEVIALRNGHLVASDVDVQAPLIRVLFEEGEVSRLIAVGDKPAPGAVATDVQGLASAISKDFRLSADSIDAIAPMRRLEKVTAVGRAHGERITDDLANANIPAISAHDWMKGDTVITTFADGPPAPDDTTASPTREVERVVAIGTAAARASSMYRITDNDRPDAPPGVNYMLAQRIIVNMKDGGVSTVDATGNVQGVYLQPGQNAVPAQPPRSPGGGGGR
jgi:hypothetical protein